MALFVTPGGDDFCSITPLDSSDALPLSRLWSPIPSPWLQCLATVCLCGPHFFPTCVKLGFTPSRLHTFGPPMMLLPNRAPSDGRPVGIEHIASGVIGESTVTKLSRLW